MKAVLKTGLTRLSEPSSWVALMGLLGGAGLIVPVGLAQSISILGAGLCGVIGFFLPEGTPKA